MTHPPDATGTPADRGTPAEVFAAFLKLGLTSFGGPIAHLGYFREAFVVRRQWLDERAYADLVALCQFLPGPASSQVGFALGLMRAGPAGAAAAFIGFTLPSALLLFAFAAMAVSLAGPAGEGALHGLKIVAVAVVAQAVLGMARTLCPDPPHAAIAAGAVVAVAFLPGGAGMAGAILLGTVAGLALGPGGAGHDPAGSRTAGQGGRMPVSRGAARVALALFVALPVLLPLVAGHAPALAMFDGFYRAGALVFGGGHVVLPLLEAGFVETGRAPADYFLAGYGAAQAVPGPLFTFAAYLGAGIRGGPDGAVGALLALVAIFLPGFLILIAVLPFWDRFRTLGPARAMMQGANAAVVGILGAALWDPLFTGAIAGPGDLALAVACFVALTAWKAPAWAVVASSATGGMVRALIG